jgi:hypothetical protein
MKASFVISRAPMLVCFALLIFMGGTARSSFAATPSGSYVAVLNEANTTSDSRRSVMYYDANDIGGAPLFSVFVPFEPGTGTLYEEPNTVTVNPTTGDIYIFAFDNIVTAAPTEWGVDNNGTAGDTSDDDTYGDWDIFRINFQTVLNHWKTNYMGLDARTVVGAAAVDPDSPLPTTKANATAAELMDYVSYGVVSPYAAQAVTNLNHLSKDAGVHDQTHSNTVTLGSMTTAGGAIEKIGEVNRNRYVGNSNFHTPLVSFIDPSTLFLIDDARQTKNTSGSTVPTMQLLANDYDYRIVKRASTSPGMASTPPLFTDVNGGFNNTNTESWNSTRIAQMNLDDDQVGADPSLLSEPQSSAFYNAGSVRGVWVADRDRTTTSTAYPKADSDDGDDIAFLQLDANGNSLGYREFTASANPVAAFGNKKFDMDNDPAAGNDNTGRVGRLFVDADTGDLVVVEEGFQDTPSAEPAVIRVPVNYDDSGKIALGTWGAKKLLTPTHDTADTFKERGYFSAYDSVNDKMYFVSPGEADADASIAFGVDIYVLDLASGLTTSFNNVDDSYSLFFGGNNPDAGDKVAAFTLVAGDYNGNGVVDAADYVVWRNGGPLLNEFVGIGTTNAADYDFWKSRFGATNNAGLGAGSGGSAAVPEPAGCLLAVFGLAMLGISSRRT